MPNYDTFQLIFTGKDVTPEVMGKDKFKSCFNVREGAPFTFELWDEREEVYYQTPLNSFCEEFKTYEFKLIYQRDFLN